MKYFREEDFYKSKTASVRGIDNRPKEAKILANLNNLFEHLDKIREAFGEAIFVNSAYRSPALNRAVGGSPTSQHTKGEAVDITSADNKRLYALIKDKFEYDQLINENNYQWIHLSLKKDGKNRRMSFSINRKF